MSTITSEELDEHPDLLGELARFRVLSISDKPDRLALHIETPAWEDTFYGCIVVSDKGKMLNLAKEIARLTNTVLD